MALVATVLFYQEVDGEFLDFDSVLGAPERDVVSIVSRALQYQFSCWTLQNTEIWGLDTPQALPKKTPTNQHTYDSARIKQVHH